ncbi:MAG: outer membrane protein assembly factor BamE [Methylomonas sp.]|nr:outer membrane protein assembly factor BamE [Methylomonas sp.]PPD21064.1 MAG: outer membrane assembly protein BamE [Methylomonas sp.]PPD25306.1 MAG: outer membrane assembly protein BamE [Methylomonas sp.]PPD35284.1 MAG: outer membrane assembly protein BamE [Methylomonas sp.]PPD38499.1 MAG: outer membrane assembly protein BamE [Methylomonas sp.]
MRKHRFLTAAIALLALPACETIMTNLPGVYTIDIKQGNIIEQAMVDQLRPNMTQRQVLYLMGSPMVSHAFHQQRWDYLYSEQPGGEARLQKRLSLFFSGDHLIGMQGDFRPGAVPILKDAGETTVELPKRELDTTMWQKITGLFSGDDTPQPTPQRTEPTPAAEGQSPSGNGQPANLN